MSDKEPQDGLTNEERFLVDRLAITADRITTRDRRALWEHIKGELNSLKVLIEVLSVYDFDECVEGSLVKRLDYIDTFIATMESV